MKVGTDGVLLGAWAELSHQPKTILDIGAGTGLIALMLAQRSEAGLIDALELDANAFEQCVENFETSPWGDRLFCYHASLEEFLEDNTDTYDLIVCNPPYFKEAVPSTDSSRDRARQNSSLPYQQLIEGVSELLSDTGEFCMIAPCSEEERLLLMAAAVHLLPHRLTRVRGHAGSGLKRSLIAFGWERQRYQANELVIEHGRHKYTEAYKSLTSDFYLKM